MTNISALFFTGDDLVFMALIGLALVLHNWWLIVRYGLGLDPPGAARPAARAVPPAALLIGR